MRFMGSEHISRVRIRLMTTLKIGLKFQTDGFPQLCCSAWDCFVHMLDSSALGPLLSQIVVGLLPLLKTAPLDAAKIFTFLIIENRNSLEPFFYELYFMPDIPELEEINSVLNKVLHGRSRDVKTQFQFLVKGVSHESPEVRLLALSKLFNLLQENQSAIHQMLLGSESVDPVISQMVNTLLHGCREADPKIRTLYGKCLGELGAIDPGRLERVQSVKSGELTKFQASVTDFNFAFEYVNELGKAFLRAEDRNTQDCVAFAIQELIQLFGIKDEARSSEPGALLWRRFPDDLKEILVPLKTSRYVLNVKIDWSKLSKPIYLSRKGTNFSTWVCTLTGYLSSKIREEKVKRVFDCSRGVIRNDSQVALYLLPYVIVHVLTEGADADRDQISEEVLAVLQQLQLPDAPSQLTSDPSAAPSDLSHMAAQTVFSVLDHLQKWMHHRIMLHSAKATRRHAGYGNFISSFIQTQKLSADAEHQRIECFLGGVPQDILAYASYRCGAFTRSLRHWERHMRLTQGSQSVPPSNQHLDFLQKLYVALEEVDGVAGVMALKVSTPSLDEQILTYESSGQLTDASMCYDQAIQLRPLDLSLRQGLLKCRLALGELQSALDLCNGVLAGQSSWSNCLNAFRVEASWKLGQWDDLNMYLKTETHSRDWNVGIGQLLLAVKSRDEETFIRQLEVVRNDLMIPLSAASMEAGSYHRGYKYITRLHMLSEVQHAAVTLMHWKSKEIGVRSSIHALQNVWHDRLQITQAAYRTQEPILNLRRVLLSLADSVTAQRHIGQCWLQSAKIARKSGLLQTAHSSLLSANQFQTAEFSLEKAKWFWDRGEHDQAQSCLEKSLQEHFPNRTDLREKGNECEEYTQKRILCARVLLQLARYYEETASCESNTIVLMYREVKNIHEKWEDVHFHTAKYYDKMMSAIGAPEQQSEFVIQVVNHFGMSLQYGNQFIYQSMPRMLSLWLDFGSEESTHRSSETSKQMVRATLKRLNKLMSHFSQKLSPYQFLTALPQLTSRICHTDADVFYQLKQIIGQLLVAFPQQTMWMLMAVSKSSFPMRIKRCQEIFNLAKTINRGLSKFLNDSTKLTEKLLDLCNKPYEIGRNTLSISHHFKPLLRLVEDNHFSQILIPLERLMTPTLPVVAMPTGSHDPFPSNQLFISGIEDTVEILPSLQKPKKLTLRGSDGRLYIVLCKPKDDLRKDARLMEFNGLINKCLRKDAEARRRGLYIRTYSVIPLNEECGILEWVNHVHGLRNILLKIYKERGLYTPGSELKQMQLPPDASIDQKLSVFKNKLLVRHPAVFSEWFLQTFPDPTSWYNARLSYCRTTAVMSLAGYILGLGDRHGENFNVDATSGDCVHVDFNCLFNKGETFEYPEVVPFRLTHNMVEAMGPLKTEGIFRRSCEVTMRVMRDQNDPLMSVLKTFIYDPLVEWNKPARGKSNESGEIKNEKAQTHVNNIEARLKGKLKNKTKPWGLPLSVDGHCKHLIKEATDEKNLCCMYIGWSAYM
ncbi:hypothetical protein CAPTEDRAFT_164972 [Capitella teleta]|uniref:Serine/threonine-protein kinase ATR n=1 Tax=Capitella teleta TaxID=283909 RepID=R7TU09_CAPTE|nr:hypothetical protein CAPTEDRAFT_164972 [Capitella teleta]|eukprot:ELT94946.1 hypothetical protein CAPTEDRAFT_164972 [Capitella teleta]